MQRQAQRQQEEMVILQANFERTLQALNEKMAVVYLELVKLIRKLIFTEEQICKILRLNIELQTIALEALLRERELPVSGKRKADYVERLAADDLARQAAAAASSVEDDDDDDLDEDEDDDLNDDDDEDEDDLDDEEDELDVVDALSEALVSAPDDELASPASDATRSTFAGLMSRWM